MIDENYIEKLADGCDDADFTRDANGVIHSPILKEYIDQYSKAIQEMMPQSLARLQKEKLALELLQADRTPEVARGAIFFDLVTNIFNFCVKTAYRKGPFHDCLAALSKNMISIYQAFLALIISGLVDASLPHLRKLYELYILLRYIIQHKELAQRYIDHGLVVQYKILNAFAAGDASDQLKTLVSSAIANYGKPFLEKYGWTASIIPEKKNRRLSFMATEVGADDYHSLYVLTSEVLHASSFSVNSFDPSRLIRHINAAAIELLTNGIIHFMKSIEIDSKRRIILMNVVNALREDIYGEPPGLGRTVAP